MRSIRTSHLNEFHKGWLIGDFHPTLLASSEVEVGVKFFQAGEKEETHYQRIATEFTVIVSGKGRFGDLLVSSGQIVAIDPGVACDFEALEDTALVVIKSPSLPDDKVVGVP